MKSESFLVIGDLHYDPSYEHVFEKSVKQLNQYSFDTTFQLGDLGGYHYPGTKESFLDSKKLFNHIKTEVHTLIGNHDMEGEEYHHDEENRQVWLDIFQQEKPYKAVDIGPYLGISLSTWSFRNQPFCSHQVTLGDEQYQWLLNTLESNKDRPTFIFCHVPIISSGLMTLVTPHLGAPNAFLDQTEDPFKYDTLLKNNPQIKLWFSGHNHLGHQYENAISQRHQCTFVHTGTMSTFSRDTLRQSRRIEINDEKINIYSIDHNMTKECLDTEVCLNSLEMTHHQKRHLSSLGKHHFTEKLTDDKPQWNLRESTFQWHKDHLIEYDSVTKWPVGVVYRGKEVETTNDLDFLYLNTPHGEEYFAENKINRYFRPHIPSRDFHLSHSPLPVNWGD